MENLLLLIPLLACPLAMLALGAIGWLWAKTSGRRQRTERSPTGSAPDARAAEGA
jgi:hypothetical protein